MYTSFHTVDQAVIIGPVTWQTLVFLEISDKSQYMSQPV